MKFGILLSRPAEQDRDSSLAAIVELPSLHWLCICKSPLIPASHWFFAVKAARASAIVRNPERIGGGEGVLGRLFIQSRIRRAM